MSDTAAAVPNSDLGAALGRVPSGLFVLTVRHGSQSTGMLASWVMQAGFNPPMITVAVQKNRYILDWIRGGGQFVLNQVPLANKTLTRQFGKGFKPDEDAFAGVGIRSDISSGIVLEEALAYLTVKFEAEATGGDHVIVLGTVVEGKVLQAEGPPYVHIRANGYNY